MEKEDVKTDPSTVNPGSDDAMKATLESIANEWGDPNKTEPEKKEPAKEPASADEKKGEEKKDTDPLKALSDDSTFKKAQEEAKVPLSRFKEVNDKRKDAEKEVERLQKQLEKEQNRKASLSEEEREESENLKKMGVNTKEWELEDKLEEKTQELERMKEEEEAARKDAEEKQNVALKARIAELEWIYDGSNWLPKFDIKELLEFAKEENYYPSDPAKLYKLKHAEAIASLKKSEPAKVEKASWGNQEAIIWWPKKTWENFEEEAMKTLGSLQA